MASGVARTLPRNEAVTAAGRAAASGLEPGQGLLFLREEQLRQARDLFFRAQRDLGGAGDAPLLAHGLGRAHGRALEAIGGRPGITVGGLLRTLRVTKQSLARVLAPLVEGGYVRQVAGRHDRRARHLTLTDKGAALERAVFEIQRTALVRAFGDAGAAAVDGFRRVLRGLVDPAEPAAEAERADAVGGGAR